ncbi:MAG TPA: MarR family transcriptional regulator [Candidatus Paceibacterota bacterium]|jgi:DNA-binding MarR family transcriptional regulator|nr:MarR family transcriptional regulator [Candidatus Paceibacterota bacterium]
MEHTPGTDTTATLFTEVSLLIKSRLQGAVGMPLSQCQTLWFVAQQKKPGAHTSMQDVARYFNIKAPSATFLVEELVQAGLLERRANTKDRRRVELMATPKGKRAFKTFETKKHAILSKLFGPLDARDRKELNRILQEIIKNNA